MIRLMANILVALALLVPHAHFAGAHQGTLNDGQNTTMTHGTDHHCLADACAGPTPVEPTILTCCDSAIGHCVAAGLLVPRLAVDCDLTPQSARLGLDLGGFLPSRPPAADPPPPRT